jgi:hypothetical protein
MFENHLHPDAKGKFFVTYHPDPIIRKMPIITFVTINCYFRSYNFFNKSGRFSRFSD